MPKNIALQQIVRFGELALWIVGSALLIVAGARISQYLAFQHHLPPPSGNPTQNTLISYRAYHRNLLLPAPAHLVIPGIHLDLQVLEGDDDRTLALGPGHLPDTAPIGSLGNAVIAGHRDMAFRALRLLKIGDEVRITTSRTYVYEVKQMKIVKPTDLSVLETLDAPTLTIITCYPFYYVGDAPRRFVVRAKIKQL